MAKKKEKATESKTTKGESFLDALRPTTSTGKPETRGTGHTTVNKEKSAGGKNTKAVAGGVAGVAVLALALAGWNMRGHHTEDAVTKTAPAAVSQHQPVRATTEAAAASMMPQPLAPQKTQLAQPSKPTHEVAKPSKDSSKKTAKVAKNAKSKDSAVKKKVASTSKSKAVKAKSKKTLAAKSMD